MEKKALMVVTNNGWYLSELTHVYWQLLDAGFKITFASPKGGAAPIDPDSKKLDDPENRNFFEKFHIVDSLETVAMKNLKSNDFDIIYFAGGHGTMWDFPDSPDIQRMVSEIYEAGGIVSAVCHGPSALVNVKLSDGSYLVEGKAVNSFTDEEEREVKKDKVVPFLLESKLRERGGLFDAGRNWEDKVVVADRLITGQNPQSASSLGKALVKEALKISETQYPLKTSSTDVSRNASF